MIIQNTSAPVMQPARTGGRDNASPDVAPPVAPRSTAPTQRVEPKEKVEQASDVGKKQPSPEQLQEALDVINTVMQQSGNRLEFSMDKDTNMMVVKLLDTETGELIRQIPSEETLAIARSIDHFQQGMLLNQKA